MKVRLLSKGIFVALSACVATSTLAATSWLSKSITVNKKGEQRSTFSTSKNKHLKLQDSTQTLFDITISLHNSPAGDDDYSTLNGDEQEKYEAVIENFADAVCEQSNGAHHLRNVRFFKNKKHQAKADIVWNEQEWPRANLSGFGSNGMHIFFGDIFPNGSGQGNDYNNLDNPIGAGHTLAHEWGHYVYGVFDEYAGDGKVDSSPQETDLPPSPSIMANQWLAEQGGAMHLNHSTAGNIGTIGRTAQSRVYGKSAWEVLVQETKDDPKSGAVTAQPKRTRYTALTSVEPTQADNWIKEELPTAQSECRSDLKVVWVSGDLDMQVIIDRSGSMSGAPIENARQAATLLVDATAEGATALGVVSFSSNETQDSPLKLIPSPGDTIKQEIKEVINAIRSGGSTALYDATQFGLDNTLGYQLTSQSNAPAVAFVLADGDDNSSSNSEELVIASYQAANIPIFTFGYGSASPTGSLLRMANNTGGQYFSSPTTLAEITGAFLQANAVVSDNQNLLDTSNAIAASSNLPINLQIDSGIKNASVFINYDGLLSDVSVDLIDPLGKTHSSFILECTALGNGVSCSGNITSDTLLDGGSGTWNLVIQNNLTQEVVVDSKVSAEPSALGTYDVSLAGTNGNLINYPEPMLLTTAITKDYMITGADVTATIIDPSNMESQVLMKDDGTNGDAVAGDGIYSSIINYGENGTYQAEVRVSNSQGNAAYTTTGILTPTRDGSIPTAPVLPLISENFERVSRTNLVVDGKPFDDGDDSAGLAVTLEADNSSKGGVIDEASDIDYVLLDNIDSSHELVVRVTDLSLEMLPMVSVYASDGVTKVLSDLTLSDNISNTGYFFVKVPSGSLESQMYVSIKHEDATADKGGYQVSAGEPINSDVIPNFAPVATEDTISLFVGEALNIRVIENDSDADGDNLILVSINTLNTLGSATPNLDNGTVNYNTVGQFDNLIAGEQASDQFSYIVTDDRGGFSKSNVMITVTANTAPTAVDNSISVSKSESITFNVLDNDSDIDGQAISLQSIEQSQIRGQLTMETNGNITYSPNGIFDSLKEGESATETFDYVVTDGLATSTAKVSVTVTGKSKKSGGGSVPIILILFLSAILLQRQRRVSMR